MKLTERNIPKYLEGLDVFHNVNWNKVKAIEVKKHTNVNFVFKVTLNSKKHRSVYIKQAFNFVKVAPEFPAPINRQLFEKFSTDYLQKYWGGRIPVVVYYDNINNILILNDIGKNTKLLAEEIEKGNLHLNVVDDLGKLMAKLHFPTYAKHNFPIRNKKENIKHTEFIFDFRLRGAREISPQATDKLFKKSLNSKTSITYGDWASKNILLDKNELKIVDFENVVRFDPAFDIGYALAHWVLELNENNKKDIELFLHDFEKSYYNNWGNKYRSDLGKILKRATNYTGAMMLHRLAGTKNTNRRYEYLKRKINLIEIAKIFLSGSNSTPSKALDDINI